MTQFPDLPTPEMRATAGDHGNNAGRQLAEKRQRLITPQLFAQHHLSLPDLSAPCA